VLCLFIKEENRNEFPNYFKHDCLFQQQQQPSLLFSSKLGQARDKPHERKKYKTRAKKGKIKDDKKTKSKKEKRQ
jgi:hypothetical protein